MTQFKQKSLYEKIYLTIYYIICRNIYVYMFFKQEINIRISKCIFQWTNCEYNILFHAKVTWLTYDVRYKGRIIEVLTTDLCNTLVFLQLSSKILARYIHDVSTLMLQDFVQAYSLILSEELIFINFS